MALRAVPDHPKFADLKTRLKQPKGSTLGWLETIWHFTGRFTPQGNIGKYSDAAIEAWVEWNGEPGELLTALVESGWIDRSQEHRLLVHDWNEHADDATRQAIKRKKVAFLTNVGTPSGHRRDTVGTETLKVVSPSGLPGAVPVPVPEPVPEPVPVGGAQAHTDEPPPSPVPAEPDLDDEEANIPDDLPLPVMGNYLLQCLSIPHSHGLSAKFANCVDLIARDEAKPRGKAALALIIRARDHPPDNGKWRFWLEDGSWKERVAQGISTDGWE